MPELRILGPAPEAGLKILGPEKKPELRILGPAPEAGLKILGPEKRRAPDDDGELMKGFTGGMIGTNPTMAGEALDAVGVLSGQQWLIDAGERVRGFGEDELKKYQADVPSYRDIESLGDVGRYAGFQFGQGVASMAPSLVIGGATSAVTANPIIGFAVGATGPSYIQNLGDVHAGLKQELQAEIASGNISRKNVALAATIAAIPMAALDVIGLGKVGGSFVKKGLREALIKRITNEAARGFTVEGITEGLQETISQFAQSQMSGRAFATRERFDQIVDNAIAGALSGGGISGTGGAVAGLRERTSPAQVPEEAPSSSGPSVPIVEAETATPGNVHVTGEAKGEQPQAPFVTEFAKGRAAVDVVLRDETSVQDAMSRPDLGSITIDYGEPGNSERSFDGGWGLSHIIARRDLEGGDGQQFVREVLPETLARGKLARLSGPPNARRANIVYRGNKAILSLYRHGDRETWVLSGYEIVEGGPGGKEGVNPSQPYARKPLGIQAAEGAEPNPNISVPAVPDKAGFKPPQEGGGEGPKIARAIGPLQAFTEAAKQKYGQIADRYFGWYGALGRLPEQKAYLGPRYRTLGRITKVEEIGKKMSMVFDNASEGDKRAAYAYLTTKGAQPAAIQDPDVRAHAVGTKRMIDRVGKILVSKGLLSRESYEKYQDEYLPRVYLKHILEEPLSSAGSDKRISRQGYLKERKNISAEDRAILGEIQDPGYLAARGFIQPLRDVAISDFLQGIASNPEWVFPENVVEWEGKRVSIHWLHDQATEIKSRLPYYSDPEQKVVAENRAKEIDAIVEPRLLSMNRVPDDYRQIPDSKRYGELRGLYVRKEIYNDLVGAMALKSETVFESVFGQGGVGTKITRWWKLSKVALNPPTQIRNFISNGILLNISGVPLHRVPDLWVQAGADMAKNGKYWKIAKQYGVTAASFSANELVRMNTALTRAQAKGGHPLALMRHMAGVIAGKAGDLYQLSEGLNKTAKIRYEMEANGKTAEQAAIEAHEAVFDYSLIPPAVRYARNSAVGVPFLTFYYKVAPRIIETAVTAPWRYVPYVVLPYALAEAVQEDWDIDDKDWEALKLALPEWLRDQGSVYLLPWKDEHGRWQYLNFGYMMPWSLFSETYSAIERGDVQDVFSNTGLFGGPIPQIIMAISTGIDPFTKRKIWNESDPPSIRLKAALNFIYTLGAPSWLTDRGFAGHMLRTIKGDVNRYGDPLLTEGQSTSRLFGLNVYPVEPAKQRQRNLRWMDFEIKEADQRMRSVLRNKNLSPEDRRDLTGQYREWVKRLIKERQEYAKKSSVSVRKR